MNQILCPFCSTPGFLKEDSKGYPWWGCPCKVRIFFHSDVSVLGFLLISAIVEKSGQEQWVKDIAALKQQAIEKAAFTPAAVARVFTEVKKKVKTNEMEVDHGHSLGRHDNGGTDQASKGDRREGA